MDSTSEVHAPNKCEIRFFWRAVSVEAASASWMFWGHKGQSGPKHPSGKVVRLWNISKNHRYCKASNPAYIIVHICATSGASQAVTSLSRGLLAVCLNNGCRTTLPKRTSDLELFTKEKYWIKMVAALHSSKKGMPLRGAADASEAWWNGPWSAEVELQKLINKVKYRVEPVL